LPSHSQRPISRKRKKYRHLGAYLGNLLKTGRMAVKELLSEHTLFRTHDLDDARDQVARVFCPHRLTTAASSGEVDAVHNSVKLKDLSVNYLDYGAEVNITPGELNSFFLVQIPLSGGGRVTCGSQNVESSTRVASVPSPTEHLDMTWQAQSPHLLIHLSRISVERRLEELMGRSLSAPIRFDLAMQMDDPGIRSWRRIVDVLVQNFDSDVPELHECVQAEIESACLTGLLTAQPHNYSACLTKAAEPAAPRSVRKAMSLCEEKTYDNLTIGEMAAHAGVSVRSLQEGFRSYVGLSPTQYLREVKLRGVHVELSQCENGDRTVSEIAGGWGFTHLGRFSHYYADRYGELPSETLRGV
jgi:AraC-like DNA-binding protein